MQFPINLAKAGFFVGKMIRMDQITADKIKRLEEQLAKYKAILADKMSRFRGVRHENSLSELRYTEVMVYKTRVVDLEKEIKSLKSVGHS